MKRQFSNYSSSEESSDGKSKLIIQRNERQNSQQSSYQRRSFQKSSSESSIDEVNLNYQIKQKDRIKQSIVVSQVSSNLLKSDIQDKDLEYSSDEVEANYEQKRYEDLKQNSVQRKNSEKNKKQSYQNSNFELEESLESSQKDTFRKLRDELFEQVDTEREKNKMLEEKLISRDKSFLEMKSQLNELVLNYSTKEKECQLLRENLYSDDERENDSSHFVKPKKKSSQKFQKTHETSQEKFQERKISSNKELMPIKRNDYGNYKDKESESNDYIRSKSIKLEQKLKQEKDLKFLKKELEEQKLDNCRVRQKAIELEIQAEERLTEMKQKFEETQSSQTNFSEKRRQSRDSECGSRLKEKNSTSGSFRKQIDISSLAKRKNSTNSVEVEVEDTVEDLKIQLEEVMLKEKQAKGEIKTLQYKLKEKEQNMKMRIALEEADNQAFLKKAEELLKSHDNLKEENQAIKEENQAIQEENNNLKQYVENLQSQIKILNSEALKDQNKCALLQKEIDQLKQEASATKAEKNTTNVTSGKSSESKEKSLRQFAQQQDKIITRLNLELENIQKNYDNQLITIQKYLKEIVEVIFDQRGDTRFTQLNITFSELNSLEDETKQQDFLHIRELIDEIAEFSNNFQKYQEFQSSFVDMIVNIGKNELPAQPTLNDCWRYFKLVYQQYLHLKIEDKVNQSTSSVLLKMLKLKNEHQIVMVVQELLDMKERQNLVSKQTQNLNQTSTLKAVNERNTDQLQSANVQRVPLEQKRRDNNSNSRQGSKEKQRQKIPISECESKNAKGNSQKALNIKHNTNSPSPYSGGSGETLTLNNNYLFDQKTLVNKLSQMETQQINSQQFPRSSSQNKRSFGSNK